MTPKEMKSALMRQNPKWALSEHLAEMIKSARLGAKMTQLDLAKKLGTKQENVARWEAARHEPSLSTLQRIAIATGHKLKMPRFTH